MGDLFEKIKQLGNFIDESLADKPGKFGPKADQEFPVRRKLKQLGRMVIPPGGVNEPSPEDLVMNFAPMMGLTKFGAAREIGRSLKGVADKKILKELDTLTPGTVQGVMDLSDRIEKILNMRDQARGAIDVIKQSPKKLIGRIGEINIAHGYLKDPGYSGNFQYKASPEGKGIITGFPTNRVFESTSGFRNNKLGDLIGHEEAHQLIDEMVTKKGYEQDEVYRMFKNRMEALAEYYKAMKFKTPPVFGHGDKQAEAFKEIPTRSKNIEYNILRRLEDILAESPLFPAPKKVK